MIMQTEKNNCISERICELNMQINYHFFVKDGKLGRFFYFLYLRIYRENFLTNREIVRFLQKPWVPRQNRGTWQVC